MENLLVINYAMDENHPIFPHQIAVVKKLAKHFESISVITNQSSTFPENLPANIKIFEVDWKENHPFSNSLNFFLTFIKVLRINRPLAIFSHMTEVQSALISPLARFVKIPHILWYAHKSRSKFLVWNSLWITKILTSTRASCPLKSSKVVAIGQGVDASLFSAKARIIHPRRNRWISVGRIDPSKKTHLLIDIFLEQMRNDSSAKLTIVGSPSSSSTAYLHSILNQLQDESYNCSITFVGALHQKQIVDEFYEHDLFIHAFQGSLDKVLVEATLSGIPVITCNHEYLKDFGTISDITSDYPDYSLLKLELSFFRATSDFDLQKISKKRLDFASHNHSLETWIARLVKEIRDLT